MFLLLVTLSSSRSTFAYEVTTHENLSRAALEASVLNQDEKVLRNMGLKPLSDEQQFHYSLGEGTGTISTIVQYGVEQEDNGHGSRFFHHFYDPLPSHSPAISVTDTEILAAALFFGYPYRPLQASPYWALEESQTFDDALNGQHHSFRDARAYFFTGLTGTSQVGFGSSRRQRSADFGLTFQSLGHIIHHIQDMAQPQHVKNEKHPLAPASLYEHFTKYEEDQNRPLPYEGYEPVFSLALEKDHTTFDTPWKFWTTRDGKGLAEFTNSNFVTYGHNFIGSLTQPKPDPMYPNPDPTAALITAKDGPVVPDPGLDQTPLHGKMYFVGTRVTDHFRSDQPPFFNEMSSTYSIYDYDLDQFSYRVDCFPPPCTTEAVFSVKRFTMLEAHKFLIPRAAGYSAGLINYFFRGVGKVDLVPDLNTANPGGYLLKNLSDEEINGTFTLYYDDVYDHRHLWQTWSTNGTLAAQTGQVAVSAFTPPADPDPKYPGQYMLVFTGQMGQETQAVAANIVSAATAGMLIAAGGDASGFARPGDGGAVTIETGVSLSLTSPATMPLLVLEGDSVTLGGGLQHYSEIAILGTLQLTADTILRADGPVGISGTVEGHDERDGIHLTIESGDVIGISGTITVAGRSGLEMGSGDQPGGNGGSVTLRTASTDVFSVPTIITRGGDAALTDIRVPTKAFTGGIGGPITITTSGGVANELALRFVGTERPTTATDTLPPQQGAHALPSTTTFRRGMLTTGGYGGQFKGPAGELGVTVAGTAGGAGGNITIECSQPSTLHFDNTDLFTGGNIDVLLTYTRQVVFANGQTPRLTNFFQRTGAMGGQGSSGQTHTHGGSGGKGGAAGAMTITGCALATLPASFTSPPRVAPLILGGNPVTGLVTAPRPRIIDAFDANGARLYSIQAFGGGGGLPGGSGLSLARCSKTGAQCYTDGVSCPLAPDFTAQICLPVAGGTGSPGNWGPRGADGPVSCGPLFIPSSLVGTGLVCQ